MNNHSVEEVRGLALLETRLLQSCSHQDIEVLEYWCCSNIAVSIIEIEHNAFDTHKYLSGVKHNSEEFRESYEKYKERYVI